MVGWLCLGDDASNKHPHQKLIRNEPELFWIRQTSYITRSKEWQDEETGKNRSMEGSAPVPENDGSMCVKPSE